MNISSSRKPVTPLIWVIWLGAALFYFYQFVLRVSPGIMAQDLMQAYQVNGCDLGLLGAYYYKAYAFMQIPLGLLLDRFGARKLLTISCIIAAIGALVFAQAPLFEMAAFGRLLMGIGAACGFIGTLKIASQLFPPQMMGRIIGFTMVLGTLGATFGGMPLGYLIERLSWRGAMMIVALIGFALALFIFCSAKQAAPQAQPVNAPSPKILDSLIQIITSRQIWLVGLFGSLMYVPLAAIADLWGTLYIAEMYQIDRKVAAVIVSMIYVGVAVGSPITAYYSDYLRNRKIPMLIGALGSLGVYLAILLLGSMIPPKAMYVMMFLGGFCFTGQCLVFAIITESLPLHITGVAIGFINTIVMLSGVIFEPLVGWLLDRGATQSGLGVTKAFSVQDFSWALAPVPLSLLVALIVLKFIRESYPRS